MPTIKSTFLKTQILSSFSSDQSFSTGAKITSIEFYTGSQPSSPQDSATGTLIATPTINTSNFTTAVNGISQLHSVLSVTPISSGIIGWARIKGSGGALFDTEVGQSGSAGIIISSISVISGVDFTITSFIIRQSLNNGKVAINTTLADRIVDLITGKRSAVLAFVYSLITVYEGAMPLEVTTSLSGNIANNTDSYCGFNRTGIYTEVTTQNIRPLSYPTTAGYIKITDGTIALTATVATDTSQALQVSTVSFTNASEISPFILGGANLRLEFE